MQGFGSGVRSSVRLIINVYKPGQLCLQYCSLPKVEEGNSDENELSSIITPGRVHSLIASETDPLLAKEIFEYASKQPNFRHSHSSYLLLILKLGRAKYFSLVDNILVRLHSDHYPLTPTLFYYIIKVYGEVDAPDKALRMFHVMSDFKCNPLPKHLNCVLKILVSRRSSVKQAFDFFKSAHKYNVKPDVESYNILMRAMCRNDDLSIAYKLFNQMFKRDVVPTEESYRILMQGLCKKGQVNAATGFLEDMLNKGYIPEPQTYTTMLNSLCRKNRLRDAYKLLCRMKVKGCNPDIDHYNTVVTGFVREGNPSDACKVLVDMEQNGCLPDAVTYRTLVNGLCIEGCLDEARMYFDEMVSKRFSPHFSTVHGMVTGFCNVGRVEEACGVLAKSLEHEEVPHVETWNEIVPRLCEVVGVVENVDRILEGRDLESESRKPVNWLEMKPLVKKPNQNMALWYVHKAQKHN